MQYFLLEKIKSHKIWEKENLWCSINESILIEDSIEFEQKNIVQHTQQKQSKFSR